MKLLLKFFLLLLLIIVIGYFLGPRQNYPAFNAEISPLNIELNALDAYIAKKESQVPKMRSDNHARIVWADTSKQKTEYAIVYLHGFSASPVEGDPIHYDFAKRYGCNMYLARLAQHGIGDEEIFADLTPKALIESAKEAIAIGKLLGNKIIVMSCSTGSTLSAYLASENPEDIHAQIMYSPNFDLHDQKSHLLLKPWGLQLARKLIGTHRSINMSSPEANHYWTTKYRVEGVLALRSLVSETMTTECFAKIKQAFFVGYYKKNETEFDNIISIDAIKKFVAETSTPKEQKVERAFKNVDSHVIVSKFQSQDIESVRAATFKFADDVLGLKAVN